MGIDFTCKSREQDELSFSQININSEDIVNLSKKIKNNKKDKICTLPFCSTLEVEALGGEVILGDEKVGPRVKSFAYETIEELKNIEDISLNQGRIKEFLDAIEKLRDENEIVCLNISGPFIIATSLTDPMTFYKALRKDRELVKKVLKIIEDNILRFVKEALKRGASIISFSDSVASEDIVGPFVYKDIVGVTILSVLERLGEIKNSQKFIIHICGKTSVSLESHGYIKSSLLRPKRTITYGQFIIKLINSTDNVKFIGHSCMKRSPNKVSSKVWKINLQ